MNFSFLWKTLLKINLSSVSLRSMSPWFTNPLLTLWLCRVAPRCHALCGTSSRCISFHLIQGEQQINLHSLVFEDLWHSHVCDVCAGCKGCGWMCAFNFLGLVHILKYFLNKSEHLSRIALRSWSRASGHRNWFLTHVFYVPLAVLA